MFQNCKTLLTWHIRTVCQTLTLLAAVKISWRLVSLFPPRVQRAATTSQVKLFPYLSEDKKLQPDCSSIETPGTVHTKWNTHICLHYRVGTSCDSPERVTNDLFNSEHKMFLIRIKKQARVFHVSVYIYTLMTSFNKFIELFRDSFK